ncbi:DUF4189 domain-containing protein [Xanthomonas sp. GPE 39]|uniref:DUF4189 domain-containing protein n=1 Tax=Xanthomonas sp. GPE 39 TaxID=1583099 RepID=UPI0009E4F5B9|nr:DUF4189 domain-containing protein [Xanthomonas sp. GPE 39]
MTYKDALMRCMVYIFCAILLMSFDANAEGNCPPGQYPIGGQGAVGCAPIPQDNLEPQQPRPAGKWLKTWGALAANDGDDFGVSTGKLKKADAENDAINNCERETKKKCSVVHVYENQCVAVAEPNRRGDIIRSIESGPSLDEISSRAIMSCQRRNPGSECSVAYTDCTKQIFQRF